VTSGFFETPLVWADPLSLRPTEAIPVTAAVELAVGVAECLATCPGSFHANLKESHILVDDRGTVSLIDPDPTHRGWVGTRAPEQSEGVVGPGTDVYALGCLLFGWCTGEAVPTSPLEEAVRNEKVQNMSRYGLPLQLQLLLRRMLRADPQDRLPGAEAAAEALRLVNLEDTTSNLKMWLAGSRWLRTGFWIRLRAHQETLDDPPVDPMEPTEVELKPGAFDTWTDEARGPGLQAAARPETTGKRPHSEPEARPAAAPADRQPTAPSEPTRPGLPTHPPDRGGASDRTPVPCLDRQASDPTQADLEDPFQGDPLPPVEWAFEAPLMHIEGNEQRHIPTQVVRARRAVSEVPTEEEPAVRPLLRGAGAGNELSTDDARLVFPVSERELQAASHPMARGWLFWSVAVLATLSLLAACWVLLFGLP
jgi:hypothetical protein